MQPPDLLARVVEQLPVGVFACSVGGAVLLWNARAEQLTGWDRVDVLRDGLAGLPLDAPTARRIRDELLAGRPFRGRIPATVRSGATLYFRAEPIPGPGEPILIGVLQEVDDARAADEAFALLDALWETAPVGLAFFDSELRYRRVNGAVLDLNGGTVDHRLGRTLEAVHGELGAEIAAGLREVLVDGRSRFDVPIRGRLWHGSGPLQEWRHYSYPVRSPDGEIVGVGLVVVDVTATARTRRQVDALAAERERALTRYQGLVEATSAAVWIREPDGSVVQDAPALRAITGQSVEDHRGWGFLDAVDPAHRDEVRSAWRTAVAEGSEVVTCTYRLSTGRGYRWFRSRAVPVRVAGVVVEWVGTEADVDDETRARQRLDVLARATRAVNAVHTPEAELTALAESVVPGFADVCGVYLVDPASTGSGPAGSASIAGRRSVTRLGPGIAPTPSHEERYSFGPAHPITRCVRSRAPVLVAAPASPDEVGLAAPEQQRWAATVGVTSMLAAPVVSRGVVMAALVLLTCGRRPEFTEDDRALVEELAARASTAVEQAERFEQTRQVSLALQSAMLSAPARHPLVEVQARYVPAVTDLEVGGDWHDAFTLPGGDLAVGVGDVAGHDLSAAAAMGQLRSMLRALAYETEGPADVVRKLDRVASRLDVTGFTTLVFGRICRRGGTTVFRWANAGHPPPVLVPPDGEPVLLTGGVGVVLGVAPELPRADQEVELAPGSTLLLYTDGLCELRHDPDNRAPGELLDLVRRGKDLPLPDLCEHLVRETSADTGDDMVVLALRVPGPGVPT